MKKRKIKSFATHFYESVKLSLNSSRYMFLLRVLFEIFNIIIPIILSYQFKAIVNLLLNKDVPYERQLYTFMIIMFSIIFIRILNILFENLKRILTENHNQLINNNLDKKILEKINELDISYFDNPNYHNEISNVYSDGKALQDLSFMVITVLRSIIQIFSCSAILSKINIFIPIMVIILIFPAVFIDNYVIKKRYVWDRASTIEKRKINYLKSVLNGQGYAKDIRIFHTKEYFFKKYLNNWNRWFSEKRKVYRKGTLLSAFSQLIPHLTVYSILVLIGLKIINNELTVGDFTLYNGIITQFVGGVTALFSSINTAYESEQKLTNFSNFMNFSSNIDNCGKRSLKKINNIEFCNVSFKYPNTKNEVLKNINFILNTGEITAIVGENGAGKSTIIKLLLRLYEPTYGKILINGIDIKEYKLESLHKAIGVVFQDFNTYELTLRESVALSDIDHLAQDEEIIEACEKAGFLLEKNRFKSGIDTYIGKSFDSDGVVLSGGQKQKLAIASSFFKKCSYYIMDEPNSALDPVSENELLSKLEIMSKESGALFITHKLSIMLLTDKIIVLNKGQIVGTGTHSNLMTNNSIYRNLYLSQAKNYKY